MSMKRFLTLSLLTAIASPVWAKTNVVKVCNYRSATIWAAYKQYVPAGIDSRYELSGWFRYDPNQCRDVVRNYDDSFWIWAKDLQGWNSGDAFYTDDFLKRGELCVGSGAYQNVLASACRYGEKGYRNVEAHVFDFSIRDFNVYEIGFR